jgi:haloacetate dehalogenase
MARMPVFTTADIQIAYDIAGDGPPLLLLHGFPQTRAMWEPVVRRLAERFTCVTADLRGYGASSKPGAAPDLSNYSFRAMAADQVALMAHLGFPEFHLAGHDRGGRTAHRLALDHPTAVRSLTVMDIVPTHHLLDHWSIEVSRAYYHWSFLAQPAPLPERMIGADPDLFFEACLLGWGGARLADFPRLEAYRAAWRDPATVGGMVNDYRAAVAVDYDHDARDLGRQVGCPALVLFGASGAMAKHFDVAATWAERLADMRAKTVPGGHFFVDQSPDATAAELLECLGPLSG